MRNVTVRQLQVFAEAADEVMIALKGVTGGSVRLGWRKASGYNDAPRSRRRSGD